MRWVRILSGVIAVLALAMGGLVVFVATLDLNAYKSDIEAWAEETTGRTLVIDGGLDLTWTPRPTLTTEGARFANAAWGSRPDMAVIGRLEAAVELLPLLTGRLDVQRIALSDVELLLERGADGAGNWEIAGTRGGESRRGHGGDAPVLRAVDLNDVALTWKAAPDAKERVIRIAQLRLSASDAAAPLDLSLEADIDGDAVALAGTLPPIAEAMRPGAALPVDLTGTVGGQPVAMAANLRYAADGQGAISAVTADRLSASWGETTVAGTAALTLGGPRPHIRAALKSEHIVLPTGGGGDGNALEAPLPLALLSLGDAEMSLSVARLSAGEVELTEVETSATLEKGVLRVDPATAILSDGRVEAVAVVNTAETISHHALTASWRGADFGKLAHTLHGSDTLETSGDAALDLTATGGSLRDIQSSLAGVAWIAAGKGRIANEDWELIAEDLTGRFLPFLDESPRGTLNCAVGRWTLKRGLAQTAILMIDSDRVTIAGKGTVDLARETLDMKLVPSPKDASLLSLATPLAFTGSLYDPDVSPDPLAVAKGVGSIVAGTALAGPVAFLLPFISTGSGEPACDEAAAIAEGRKAMPSGGGGGTREQGDKPGGIKGLFDSLRKAIE